MKDEKILSNEELMDITGGGSAFINVENTLLNSTYASQTSPRPVMYGIEPPERPIETI